MRKTIAVVTGSRAEYDILHSTMSAIKDHPRMKLKLVATGAHLLEKFGNTQSYIHRDGFVIDYVVKSLSQCDTLESKARSVGRQMSGMVDAFVKLKPDMVLVSGDREEVITAALAASYLNIPVAHMCGGDTAYGSVDNMVRDATTKLSHVHFPMLPEHGKRIVSMGEEKWRVHVVGHGGLDRMLTTPLLTKEELSRGLGFDVREGPVILMIQHVLSSEYRQARFQISKTMAALARLKYRTLISYPNSDAGSDAIINTIREYSRGFRCYMYKNLPREYFVNLLRYCDVLIGNSSCGIIEAPMFGLPVVNIGNRQLNRQSAGNVIYVGHDSNAIAKAINKAVFNDAFRHKAGSCSSIYGDGHTGERIARIIDGLSIDSKLLNKPNL